MATTTNEAETCASNLLASVGKIGAEAHKLPRLYISASTQKDTDFLEHMLSVIYVESRFNRNVVSEAEAYGLMQMTSIAVEESVKFCNLKPLSDMNHLFDSYTNIRYGSCYLKFVLNEADGNWTRALILYNGGYKQLTRYDNGDPIVPETANYILQVQRVLDNICRKRH